MDGSRGSWRPNVTVKGPKCADVGGLLRYLYGPGRANEHTDPHVVVAGTNLRPTSYPLDRHRTADFRPLTRLL